MTSLSIMRREGLDQTLWVDNGSEYRLFVNYHTGSEFKYPHKHSHNLTKQFSRFYYKQLKWNPVASDMMIGYTLLSKQQTKYAFPFIEEPLVDFFSA